MFTDDQDIERTLKAALDVAPSAGFEARIEQQIREARPARGFSLPAWLAAAAAIIIAAGWWFLAAPAVEPPALIEQVGQAPPPTPDPVVTQPRPVPEHPAAEPPPPSRASQPERARRAMPDRQVARRSEPEVIVPANQLEIIRRFVRELSAGRVELGEASPAAAAQPVDLVVPPVVVEPIPLVALDAGGTVPSFKGLQ